MGTSTGRKNRGHDMSAFDEILEGLTDNTADREMIIKTAKALNISDDPRDFEPAAYSWIAAKLEDAGYTMGTIRRRFW